MATLNVGAMAARLGLDPADFLDKMKGVQGFNGFVSGEMARQWKKTGRDGQEGLRLIDEALGIHVARPVARIVAETFPAMSKALSAILPGVAFSALGFAIIEFGEHIAKKMEEAKKKQDEYTEAVQKTKMVIGETDAASEQRLDKALAKAAQLRGDSAGEAHFKGLVADAEGVDQMAKAVDKLVEAELREARAKQAQMTLWAEAGAVMHEAFSFESTLEIEKINDSMQKFSREFDLRSVNDQINHTTTAFDFLTSSSKQAHDALDELVKQAAKMDKLTVEQKAGLPISERKYISADEIAAAKALVGTFDQLEKAEDKRRQAAKQEKDNATVEAAAVHARELRSELEAIQRLGETSTAAASSALLLAEATGKGTAASIQAAAAAEAQKKILDAQAGANTKLFSGTNQPLSQNKSVQQALADYAAIERQNALINQAAKGVEAYNRALGEASTHADERIAALTAEAAAHGKVGDEQAKELATLIPLQQKLQELKNLRSTLNTPTVGPPTQLAAELDVQISAGTAGLAAQTDKVNGVNRQLQAVAYAQELQKIKQETAALAGAEISPWAKIDAELTKLTADAKLLPNQITALGQALTGLQNVKIAGEFEKMAEKIREAQIETAAFASGAPFAKLDAEAQKLGREFGLDAAQIAGLRQALIAMQDATAVSKAAGAVDGFDFGGEHAREFELQKQALSKMQAQWQATGRDVDPIRMALQQITDEEDQILIKTGGVDAGIKAWADNLQQVKTAGMFVFQELTQASKGFEDDAVKSIFDVLEVQRGQHEKMIKQLRTMWSNYFNGLAQEAMKHQLDKLLAPVGKQIGSLIGPATGIGTAGGAAPLTAAGTTLQSAGIQLIAAATALRASSAGGAFAGGGALDNPSMPIPFFAAGGDATPGSSFISGEAGAEEVDLDRSGGAHITPLGGGRGGDTHQYFDQRGAVVSDDLMRKADAAALLKHAEPAFIGKALANFAEVQRRTPQR